MFENHLIPSLMFFSTVFVAFTGIAPSLNIALVGILFGLFFVGSDLFLRIPSLIYDTIYNLNWLSIPLAIFFSYLARHLISLEELLILWKILKKRGLFSIIIFPIPLNSIFTGLIGGTGPISSLENLSFFKRINTAKLDINFIVLNQLIFISLIPPSLILIILVNSTGANTTQFFIAIIFPAFLYGLICQVFFFWYLKEVFIKLGTSVSSIKTEKKLLVLKLASPYFFLIGFFILMFNDLLSLNQMLSFGILIISIFLIVSKKNDCKTIFVAGYKKTGMLSGIIFFSYLCAQFFLESFRSLGGDDFILSEISKVSSDANIQLIIILTIVLLLQFLFTWLEISFVLVPILIPVISFLDIDIVWFLVMICFSFHNLAFFTPLGINSTSLWKKYKTASTSKYIKPYLTLILFKFIMLTLVFFNKNFFIGN